MLFRNKSVRQAAALPFTPLYGGIQVLLITSRRRGRWILPKGWQMRGRSLAETAAQEAAEEAGLVGLVHSEALGSYRYVKETRRGYDLPCDVFVYPFLVLRHDIDWVEREERRLCWVSLVDAARMVDDRGLGALLGRLSEDGGRALLETAGALSAGQADIGTAPAC